MQTEIICNRLNGCDCNVSGEAAFKPVCPKTIRAAVMRETGHGVSKRDLRTMAPERFYSFSEESFHIFVAQMDSKEVSEAVIVCNIDQTSTRTVADTFGTLSVTGPSREGLRSLRTKSSIPVAISFTRGVLAVKDEGGTFSSGTLVPVVLVSVSVQVTDAIVAVVTAAVRKEMAAMGLSGEPSVLFERTKTGYCSADGVAQFAEKLAEFLKKHHREDKIALFCDGSNVNMTYRLACIMKAAKIPVFISPAGTTSALQVMDQFPLGMFKKYVKEYKNKFKEIKASSENVPKILLYMMRAWGTITEKQITASFKKCFDKERVEKLTKLGRPLLMDSEKETDLPRFYEGINMAARAAGVSPGGLATAMIGYLNAQELSAEVRRVVEEEQGRKPHLSKLSTRAILGAHNAAQMLTDALSMERLKAREEKRKRPASVAQKEPVPTAWCAGHNAPRKHDAFDQKYWVGCSGTDADGSECRFWLCKLCQQNFVTGKTPVVARKLPDFFCPAHGGGKLARRARIGDEGRAIKKRKTGDGSDDELEEVGGVDE